MVYLYDCSFGTEIQKLTSHAKNIPVMLLIFDHQSSVLCSVDPSSRIMGYKLIYQNNSWIDHPSDSGQLTLFANEKVHLYEWKTLQKLTGADGIPLEGEGLLSRSHD